MFEKLPKKAKTVRSGSVAKVKCPENCNYEHPSLQKKHREYHNTFKSLVSIQRSCYNNIIHFSYPSVYIFYQSDFVFIPGDLSTLSESDRENTSMILDDQQIPSKPTR